MSPTERQRYNRRARIRALAQHRAKSLLVAQHKDEYDGFYQQELDRLKKERAEDWS